MATTETHPDRDLDRAAEELSRDGICVLPGLLAPDLVERWRAAFTELFEERRRIPGGLAPREQSRYYLTLPWREPFADASVFAHPGILGVLDRLFMQSYDMVQMGADVPLEGSDYQELHRDFTHLFPDHVRTPIYAVAVNIPLVEVNDDNGPFQMARGTHAMPRDEALAKVTAGEIPLETFYAQPGDVTIRSPLAIHRGTPNRTATPRPVVVLGYVMSWMRTPNVSMTIPRGYLETLPENVQRLLRCEVVESLPEGGAETYVDFKF